MNRRNLVKSLAAAVASISYPNKISAADFKKITTGLLPMEFQPTWESLKQYSVPEWFRDAKFGIWAHWGPQCQPQSGDWYAREMYMEGSDKYKIHLKKYGHPSQFGFKDVINQWKADRWQPDELLSFYKTAGAKYFVALANHHDNLDLYNSTHQQWNAVRVGPKKDIIGTWANAARKNGLYFGASVHASHAWSWYETSQRSDKSGPKAGIPYDGSLTLKDGKGKWWDGLDPQELYAQNHPLSENSLDNSAIHKQWNWQNGVTPATAVYIEKFYKRTIELIDKYEPDLLYFDDTALPFWPVSDAGLKIVAHMYNKSIFRKGSVQAVINGKVLDEEQRKCMVWDIERGQSNSIEPLAWQTDTCLGNWHYDDSVLMNHKYKSAQTVIHTLIDVVSKNGNLLLSVPLRGDGSIDSEERSIVEEVGNWMRKYSECIYATRPWVVFGEGPAMSSAAAIQAQGFNEGKGKPFTSEDIRFTKKGKYIYAMPLGAPAGNKLIIKSLAENSAHSPGKIERVVLVGNNLNLAFQRSANGLEVMLPDSLKDEFAYAVKITIQRE
ncbi:MAG: alpha-L-fucosidase [Chitinophagaceae bacterium]|nr:MAG: alpha-L-fucosidase [Chitinophagaceae bacterium]